MSGEEQQVSADSIPVGFEASYLEDKGVDQIPIQVDKLNKHIFHELKIKLYLNIFDCKIEILISIINLCVNPNGH